MVNAMNLPEAWTDEYFVSKIPHRIYESGAAYSGLRSFENTTMTQACAPLAPHFHKDAYEFTFRDRRNHSFTVDQKDYELSGYDIFITGRTKCTALI